MPDLVENFEIKNGKRNRHSNEVQRKQMVAIFSALSKAPRSGNANYVERDVSRVEACRMQLTQDFND
jgi:hypothetical protein